ncbi:hypothetical protein ACQ4PT_009911 [Festuca glaucescens]
MRKQERVDRIKKELQEPQFPPSPYDTAWVAMVPFQGTPEAPCFPQCIKWILQNQQDNGSWGAKEYDLSIDKCSPLSTLACIIALKKWNVGPEHIRRGLQFIGKNFSIVMDEQIGAPIGFNVTFTGMIRLAIEMGLEFPLKQNDVDGSLQIRQMELRRLEAYMAYISEGLGDVLDWNEVMKFQRKNGSLLNSPSATVAALIYNYDDKALQYLNLLVRKFGGSGGILSCRANKDHLALAAEDFTFSQFIYQDELLHLERIDQLQFARQKQTYCYLSACATIFHPELSDARISFAKNSVLITIVDDFFDVAGSKEELENLVALVERWDEHHELQYSSQSVKILIFAIYTTVNQLAERASALQKRDVRKHLIELWTELLRSMLTEAEWVRNQYVPTIDEYMTNANLSYGLGPIIPPSLYFVGQELLDSAVKDQEYTELLRLMNICCRLLNDIQGFEAMVAKFTSISTRKLAKAFSVLSRDKTMIATSDYGEFHTKAKRFIREGLLGSSAQRRFRDTRQKMMDNMLNTFYSLVIGDPHAPQNFREVFRDEIFRVSLIESLGEDVSSVYVKEFGREISKEEMHRTMVVDMMTCVIVADWRDYFPYLGWLPNKSFDTRLVTAESRRTADRLYQEIQEVCGEDTVVTEDHLSRLPYLNAVFHETLRLHPPISVLPRRFVHQTTTLGGYKIPAGTEVTINAYGCNMNKEEWEEPEEWRPERFLDGRFDSADMFKTLSFGAGKRVCAGSAQAINISCAAIARLVQEFAWRLKKGDKDEANAVQFVGHKLHPLYVYLSPRGGR